MLLVEEENGVQYCFLKQVCNGTDWWGCFYQLKLKRLIIQAHPPLSRVAADAPARSLFQVKALSLAQALRIPADTLGRENDGDSIEDGSLIRKPAEPLRQRTIKEQRPSQQGGIRGWRGKILY